jgi:hypothetical protein
VYGQSVEAALTAGFLTLVLAILEVSLSFDNAVINATVLRKMSAKWRRRFMTWGILIAVFGMRVFFPLVVVSVLLGIDPWSALLMAALEPEKYAHVMESAQAALAGFGASFLLLVALRYFFDHEKDVHWIRGLEPVLSRIGKIKFMDVIVAVVFFGLISVALEATERQTFLVAAVLGTGVFLLMHGLMQLLKVPGGGGVAAAGADLERASLTLFVYLEFLDASFSLDGVIGAFAITTNLFIIAIGLGIGAMFVRSLTIMLVDKRTLDQFIYLEHGAFYAIGSLALIMIGDLFIHIPEAVTGLIGVAIIGLSLLSSWRHNVAT